MAAGTATSPIATATNTADAPMATQSDAQNLAVEDAIDERPFNQAIWQSIHGMVQCCRSPGTRTTRVASHVAFAACAQSR
jgi:hypothetical protein